VTYGDVFLENERQMSKWNFEVADTDALFDLFAKAEAECRNCLAHDVPIAAYEQAIEASHVFNLLQARGVISVQERASYMGRVRELARGSCEAYMAKEADRWAQRLRRVDGMSHPALQALSPVHRGSSRERVRGGDPSHHLGRQPPTMMEWRIDDRLPPRTPLRGNPARMQAGARADLEKLFRKQLGEAGVAPGASPSGRPRAASR
jgi:hypothetical protein